MKSEFLKIAGVKTEKAFYKKYPTEAAFFKAHPEAKKMIKKAQAGTSAVASYVNGMNNVPNMQNIIQGQTQSPGVNAGMFPSNPYEFSVTGMDTAINNVDISKQSPIGGQHSGFGDQVAKFAPMIGTVANVFSAFKNQKKKAKEAQMWADVTEVQADAAESQDVDLPRMYAENARRKREADMPVTTGEPFMPTQGVGTNILSSATAKNGIEIVNTFAPGTIYDDAGYEPLDDSNQVKQFQTGGNVPWNQISNMSSNIIGNQFDNNAGSQAGQALGNIVSSVDPMTGAIVTPLATIAGGAIDQAFGSAGKLKKAQQKQRIQQDRLTNANYANYNNSFLNNMGVGKNGITIAKDGTALNGTLQPMWGGTIKDVSYNPYIGNMAMGFGNDHDEYDGYGNTGIGMKVLDDGGEVTGEVEIETKEPMISIGDSVTVLGARKVPNDLKNDLKIKKGTSFKKIGEEIGKQDNKINSKKDRILNQYLDEKDDTKFGKLKQTSQKMMLYGLDAQQQKNANTLKALSSYQNDSEEISKMLGYEDVNKFDKDLETGKLNLNNNMNIREAMFGTKLTKAQEGEEIPDDAYGLKIWEGNKTGLGKKTASDFTLKEWNQIAKKYGFKGKGNREFQKFLMSHPETAKIIKARHNILYGKNPETDPSLYDGLLGKGYAASELLDIPKIATTPERKETKKDEPAKQENKFEIIKNKKNPWLNIGYQTLKGFLDRPYKEELSPEQTLKERMALSMLHPEGVQAFPLNRRYELPIDIVLPGKEDIIATGRAAMRQAGYNPAAQAAIAAGMYSPLTELNAKQFIANQENRQRVTSNNINEDRRVDLANAQIYDQQVQRMLDERNVINDTKLEAIGSISNKTAQLAKDLRTLNYASKLFEQYGLDNSGNFRFKGGYADFNIPQNQYPFYNNPNYALVKNSDGTFTYKLKEQVTEDDQVMENPKTPSMATNPINGNNVVYEDDQYEYIASPIQERNEMLPSKRTGGKIRKNYSQSSIVKAFK